MEPVVKPPGAIHAPIPQRGDIAIWFDEEAVEAWNAPSSGRPGGQDKYSDIAIVTMLTLRSVFRLPLADPQASGAWQQRNQALERIAQVGRRQWRKESGAHRQARAENGMFRYKRIIGDSLRARRSDAQKREAMIAVNVLNRMTELVSGCGRLTRAREGEIRARAEPCNNALLWAAW